HDLPRRDTESGQASALSPMFREPSVDHFLCRVGVGHASSQLSMTLPVRMPFSICRQYVPGPGAWDATPFATVFTSPARVRRRAGQSHGDAEAAGVSGLQNEGPLVCFGDA